MIDRIASSLEIKSLPSLNAQEGKVSEAAGFGEMLSKSIREIDMLQKDADISIENLAAGENTDIHQTMIAMEKADIAMKLMIQIRNKVVGAYEEIMRMQV